MLRRRVSNASGHTTGVRLTELPLTFERIALALNTHEPALRATPRPRLACVDGHTLSGRDRCASSRPNARVARRPAARKAAGV